MKCQHNLIIPSHRNRVGKPYVLEALSALEVLFPIHEVDESDNDTDDPDSG